MPPRTRRAAAASAAIAASVDGLADGCPAVRSSAGVLAGTRAKRGKPSRGDGSNTDNDPASPDSRDDKEAAPPAKAPRRAAAPRAAAARARKAPKGARGSDSDFDPSAASSDADEDAAPAVKAPRRAAAAAAAGARKALSGANGSAIDFDPPASDSDADEDAAPPAKAPRRARAAAPAAANAGRGRKAPRGRAAAGAAAAAAPPLFDLPEGPLQLICDQVIGKHDALHALDSDLYEESIGLALSCVRVARGGACRRLLLVSRAWQRAGLAETSVEPGAALAQANRKRGQRSILPYLKRVSSVAGASAGARAGAGSGDEEGDDEEDEEGAAARCAANGAKLPGVGRGDVEGAKGDRLRAWCRELGFAASGRVGELRERIIEELFGGESSAGGEEEQDGEEEDEEEEGDAAGTRQAVRQPRPAGAGAMQGSVVAAPRPWTRFDQKAVAQIAKRLRKERGGRGRKVTYTLAKTEWRLSDRELALLPHEERENPHHPFAAPMKLYLVWQVMRAARKRFHGDTEWFLDRRRNAPQAKKSDMRDFRRAQLDRALRDFGVTTTTSDHLACPEVAAFLATGKCSGLARQHATNAAWAADSAARAAARRRAAEDVAAALEAAGLDAALARQAQGRRPQ
ncbi:hypothetical protein MNEG_12699 [Monoraphidium neglectum]|uniref:XPA C-terminal domain-containing protein n=1 Tax=Monoraphidium neglectum TaxID=145388 RepID=A0A0D2KHJ3_9CHLO|nr:hypothetical protein MNEG_12699 [Monoraphidium neglectum]KIY95263.1 hypothetical protein MNEG_12699 [Monoraphidium neglectum]|eukprot:XP_013894283.1 hypothetical protein MNEG_12699 [Monoraphidium neglectum]